MAILNKVPCGGVWLDDTIFKVKNGVITLVEEVSPTKSVNACGVPFDYNVFKLENDRTGLNYVLTSANAPDGIIENYILGNCGGLMCDARYFSKTDNVLSFVEGFILTVNVTPADSGYTISVVDGDGEEVTPMYGTENQYLMIQLDATYTIVASADGYVSETQDVVANQNEVINIELVAE